MKSGAAPYIQLATDSDDVEGCLVSLESDAVRAARGAKKGSNAWTTAITAPVDSDLYLDWRCEPSEEKERLAVGQNFLLRGAGGVFSLP